MTDHDHTIDVGYVHTLEDDGTCRVDCPHPDCIPLAEFLRQYRPFCYPGDEQWTWHQVFDDVWTRQLDYMDALATSIQECGIRTALWVDRDTQVLRGGHHRVAAAMRLGLPSLKISDEES